MKSALLLCAAASILLSGCVVHEHRGPSAKVVVPVPVVKVGVDKGHCPPGQAKKGNC